MSATQVDEMIRRLDEFGPAYFELAQLTRISAQTYRAIEPSIQDGALHHNGEVIELDPENSNRLAAAVAELRNSLPPKPPLTLTERIQELQKKTDSLLQEYRDIGQSKPDGDPGYAYLSVLLRAAEGLQSIQNELGV
jgi:hypothetical protein